MITFFLFFVIVACALRLGWKFNQTDIDTGGVFSLFGDVAMIGMAIYALASR